jgi:hypothetical protein
MATRKQVQDKKKAPKKGYTMVRGGSIKVPAAAKPKKLTTNFKEFKKIELKTVKKKAAAKKK